MMPACDGRPNRRLGTRFIGSISCLTVGGCFRADLSCATSLGLADISQMGCAMSPIVGKIAAECDLEQPDSDIASN
jgi:hypothetical protein